MNYKGLHLSNKLLKNIQLYQQAFIAVLYFIFTIESEKMSMIDTINEYETASSVSEWLLFTTKWAIFQLYHGESTLHSMIW
jgi:hypothetical protein